ncbi:MAG TPA: hypothetical protein VKZ49_11970 [Polyangiaceae bacterium]|nr:hypothetical protein [Polyangiaceae bacterium]
MKTPTALSIALTGACAFGCSDYRMRGVEHPPVAAFDVTSEEAATICVFRPHGLGTSVVAPVSDNGTVVGATEGSSYFCYLAEPGKHKLRAADAPALTLEVDVGEQYHVVHELNVAKDRLVRVTSESAQGLASYCNFMSLRQTPEGVAVPAALAVARAEPSVREQQVAKAIAQPAPQAPKPGVVSASNPRSTQ